MTWPANWPKDGHNFTFTHNGRKLVVNIPDDQLPAFQAWMEFGDTERMLLRARLVMNVGPALPDHGLIEKIAPHLIK